MVVLDIPISVYNQIHSIPPRVLDRLHFWPNHLRYQKLPLELKLTTLNLNKVKGFKEILPGNVLKRIQIPIIWELKSFRYRIKPTHIY